MKTGKTIKEKSQAAWRRTVQFMERANDSMARWEVFEIDNAPDLMKWWEANEREIGPLSLEAVWDALEKVQLAEAHLIIAKIYRNPKCPEVVKKELLETPLWALSRRGVGDGRTTEALGELPGEFWLAIGDKALSDLLYIDRGGIPAKMAQSILRRAALSEMVLLALWKRSGQYPKVARRLMSLMGTKTLNAKDIYYAYSDLTARRLLWRYRADLDPAMIKDSWGLRQFVKQEWWWARDNKTKEYMLDIVKTCLKWHPKEFKEMWSRAHLSPEWFEARQMKEIAKLGLLAPDRQIRESVTAWLGKSTQLGAKAQGRRGGAF